MYEPDIAPLHCLVKWSTMQLNALAGIFVGGKGTRLGGIPKGLLKSPRGPGTLVENLAHKLETLGFDRIVLVGQHAAYDRLTLPQLADSHAGVGPKAGLLALVRHAVSLNRKFVFAFACDMPHINSALIRQLCTHAPEAVALVGRREMREPLCARYLAAAIESTLMRQLAKHQLSLMSLLDELGTGCVELPANADSAHALVDWDEPSDLPSTVEELLEYQKQ